MYIGFKKGFSMSTVQQFLDAGMTICLKDVNWIARYDEIDTLRQLVQEGINVDSQDEYGTSALHNACANGNMWAILKFAHL